MEYHTNLANNDHIFMVNLGNLMFLVKQTSQSARGIQEKKQLQLIKKNAHKSLVQIYFVCFFGWLVKDTQRCTVQYKSLYLFDLV